MLWLGLGYDIGMCDIVCSHISHKRYRWLSKGGCGLLLAGGRRCFFFYVAIAPLLYLCMLWLWINQTFYQITKSHMESLTLETLHMNRAGRWLHELLGKMESVSSVESMDVESCSTLLCLVGKRICLCVCVE
jgi:hypothetical protein